MRDEIEERIYSYLVSQEYKRLIREENCVSKEINSEELDEAIMDVSKRLEVVLEQGKCSTFIIKQIAKHLLNIGEKFNDKIEFYNASELINLIGLLERNSINYTSFNGPILKGYAKIHHGTYSSIGYSIVRNVKEFWFKKGRIRDNRSEVFQEILLNNFPNGISSVLNAMHSYAMINKDLKGEWIIFKQVEDRKIYLCLACHIEKDNFIYDNKIKSAFSEFPELKN